MSYLQAYHNVNFILLTQIKIIMKKILFTATFIALLSGCANHQVNNPVSHVNKPHKNEKAHWGYSGKEASKHWGELSDSYATCSKGKNQSPINIQTGVNGNLPALNFRYNTPATEILNNGHTVQVNIATGSQMQIGGKSFDLKQFHFHTPSENEIKSQSFPLEAHFVHADASGNLAVVAVMFKQDVENPLIKTLWSLMPANKGEKKSLVSTKIDFSKMLPNNKEYYYFNGSLTTPPCTEGVRWFVLKQAVSLTNAQAKQLKETLHHKNNRPTQPLNARIVIE